MNTFETSVYRKYRHNLHAFAKRRSLHAPERRQAARKNVVDEFNIPYAEVKRIVALGDAENGITHEKPQDHTPYADIEFKRVPVEDIQLGDRMVYAGGIDARVAEIDGLTFTFRGVRRSGEKQEWTMDYQRGDTIAIVTNRPRRVPADVVRVPVQAN